MALYFYRAFSKDGKKVSGYLDASTMHAVKEQLLKTGLYPTSISSATEGYKTKFSIFSIFKPKISLKDKVFFTKQLSVLLKSGIPILQALDLLTEQTSGALKNIVISLKENIKEGKSFAEGLLKFPRTFDSIYVQLVRAGEATGKLESILERINEYLLRTQEIQKKVKGALRYPIIQLVVIFVVVIGLLTFVVPTITKAFSEIEIELPITTRILMAISDIFLSYYYIIAIVIGIIYGAYWLFKSSAYGSYKLDALKLKLPLISYFTKNNAIVQFTRTFGLLLESGVNLPEALDIVVKIIDNKVLVQALQKARENIIKQGKISQYLNETGLFPSTAIHLISTGEQSGELGQMLTSVAKYTEDALIENSDNLTALLNPIMLIIIFTIVAFVAISILSPISKMSQAFENKMEK